MKTWKALFYVMAIIPLLFVLSLITFYFKVGLVLGQAPSYNNLGPKELDRYKSYAPCVDWALEVWLYSLLVWFGLTIIYLITTRRRIEWNPVIISGTGQIFGFFFLYQAFLNGILTES